MLEGNQMVVPNKLENPISNLMSGIFLFAFGSFSLFIAWTLTRAIDNWFILFCFLVSFIVPAFGAFWLGVKRLIVFVKFYKPSN